MALNKSMHPRNRYKDKPPDFAYLATKYPDFQKHVQTTLTGRVMLNFKDPEAVRALTCTLLKEDFGLTIEIPLERLIPTVPLRLNYIHWVEDLTGGQGSPRRGIDIGTGASCIYPLLGASMNGWYFLATEVDDICYNFAKKNVEQNNMADLIKVVKVPQKTLLMDALKEESIVYDFCMCNPPFFANHLEAKGVNSRNSRRPPPSSVNTGGVTEIMAEGGELEFVKRIIHDSVQLKRRLRWYSCMLGKKCSLAPLKEELRKQGVSKVTHTEFCQGRTMRWALAWSFYEDVTMPSPPNKKRKLEKAHKPLTFTVVEATAAALHSQALAIGQTHTSNLESVTYWLESILTDLKVLHNRVPSCESELSLFLTAVENTWVHARQKRRKQNRQLRELPTVPEPDTPAAESIDQTPTPDSTDPHRNGDELKAKQDSKRDTDVPCKTSSTQEQGSSVSTISPSATSVHNFLFKCLMNVKVEDSDVQDVLVEMHWVEDVCAKRHFLSLEYLCGFPVGNLGLQTEVLSRAGMDNRKTAAVKESLKRKEKEYEHEMERLAREKISTQQRLAELKNDLSQWMDMIEVERLLRQTVQPEDDQASTSTASEGEDNMDEVMEEEGTLTSPRSLPRVPQSLLRKTSPSLPQTPSVPSQASIHPPTATASSVSAAAQPSSPSLSFPPAQATVTHQPQAIVAPQSLAFGHILATPSIQPTVITHASSHASVIQAVSHITQTATKHVAHIAPSSTSSPSSSTSTIQLAPGPQTIGHITVHPVTQLPTLYQQPVTISHTLSHGQVNSTPVLAKQAPIGHQVITHHPQLVGQTVLNPVTMVTMPSFPVSTLKLA
ncbi:U6 small nuclear RNA (adenine-(43)-N(6))-methyltransferase [Bagarius yarrelli]|uniref:RNA N(6)-adenosine-methyltransferase METTL16 n=1 Tax=Bagarius yarrelli TaxID=175774 RepID=A0A556U6W4_BAGYA|nr:U6 small nuclear RNA (adenine-(43)-N(6))-methyltransferase [Bagarius yarrelli]